MRTHSGPARLIPNPERVDAFRAALEAAYTDLFANDPEYAYTASRCTPIGLAQKMTDGMITGDANHEGAGMCRACKAVGIKHTYTAIRAYLSGFVAG
jgi:hypothetical protein